MTRPRLHTNHLPPPCDPFDIESDWLDEIAQAYAPDPEPNDRLSPGGLCRVVRRRAADPRDDGDAP